MKHTTQLLGILALSVIASVGFGAMWSDPVLLTELNDSVTGRAAIYPHLSMDGSTLYFGRRDTNGQRQLYTATRDSQAGQFSEINQISELAEGHDHNLYTPWVSTDGLRLYYGEYIGGTTGLKIRVAARESLSDSWGAGMLFDNIHMMGDVDLYPSLSPDELTMYYATDRNNAANDTRLWKATRSSINEQFSNPTKVLGLDIGNITKSPCVLPDGLTIYYSQLIGGKFDLYRATRNSTSDPFGNIEPLSLNTVLGNEMFAYVTPDQSEIFFTTDEGIMYAYLVPEPATLGLLVLGGLLLRKTK